MLTLAIGDLFIPERAVSLPAQFTKLLAPDAPKVPSNRKITQVLCLGNITQSGGTVRFLHELSPSLNVVRGEFDDEAILSQQLQHLSGKHEQLPLYRVVTADNFRIGFTSGHQIVPQNDPLLLLAFAREIDVDVLIWGGTHRVEAYTLDGKFFINPGSATGAFSMAWLEADEEFLENELSESETMEASNGDLKQEVEEEEKKVEMEREEFDGEQGDNGDQAEHGDQGEQGEQGQNGDNETNSNNDESPQNNNHSKDLAESEFDDTLYSSSIPSFCLLDTNSSRCTLYIYTYVMGEVKVDKVIYSKE